MDPTIHTEDLRLRSGPLASPQIDGAGPLIAATLYLPADAAGAGPPAAAPLPALVVGHGAGSRRGRHRTFCLAACAAGMVVMAIDFRGHGESTGVVDGPLHEDIAAAARLLRSHPLVDGARIGYRGSSMGGYYGVLAAAAAELAALALLCPAGEQVLLAGLERMTGVGATPSYRTAYSETDDPGSDMRVDRPALRDFLRGHAMLSAADEVTCPVLLRHARGDEVVPLTDTLGLAARLRGPVEVVVTPGGDHRALQASAGVHRHVAQWLATALGGSTDTTPR